MDLDLLNNDITELWLDSLSCATNCIRNSDKELKSSETYFIKYNLFEPSCEQVEKEFMQLGKYRGEDNNFYRYTGIFFFGTKFNTMLKEASKIEVTFDLDYSSPLYLGTNTDDAKSIFNNNFILRGHSFNSHKDLMNKWNDLEGYEELKYHLKSPCCVSIYKELRSAILNNKTSFSFILDEAMIKEFEAYDIKGLHLYCHDTINGLIRIKPECKLKVLKFKNFYDDSIASNESFTVQGKKIYDDQYLYAGGSNNYSYFLFENKFKDALDKAKKMKVTFNFAWYMPSKEASLINTNSNFLKDNADNDAVILSGHGFKNSEELYNCKSRDEIAEVNKENYSIEVHASFKQALEEGQSSYSFVLNEDDINMLSRYNTQGLKIGLKKNGLGFWRMSKICCVEILEYKDSYQCSYFPSENSSWININESAFVGRKLNEENGEHAAFYFFNGNLHDHLNTKRIQNITVRFYFNKESLKEIDDNYNVHYYMCGHKYPTMQDAMNEDYIVKANGICEFFNKNIDAEYIDIILNKEQISFLKNYQGLCFYSKQNTALTSHSNRVSIYIDYSSYEEYASNREFTPMSIKSFIIEDKMTYDKKFICGSTNEGYLYKPFMYLGDNFHDFMNKEEILSVKLIIVADRIHYYDGRASSDSLKNISFYTHDVSYNEANYELYNYKDFLFKIDLGNLEYAEIDLNETQLQLFKNSHGLGALVENNNSNDFLVIKEFDIIVTYVNLI